MHVRRRRKGRGQALVEFALVFPLFALLLFGLIDLGRYVYVTNAFNQAAREAARFGSVEQYAFSCPASVPLVSQDRFTCTKAIAQLRLSGYTFDATASTVTCSDGTPPTPNSRTAAKCRANDLLLVYLTSGTGANQFRFFTPIIGQLVAPPTIVGQAQVAVQ
ncbi:MAG: pilus assembly protein [Chloroflexi bacterium]|nr:pilus assembly protein [Chloroflexota bacterium]